MQKYFNCIAIKTGINKPHTLIIDGQGISITYVNSLNLDSIKKYLKVNSFFPVSVAYDMHGRKYKIYTNGRYNTAIRTEYIKPLTIPEMIKKYGLNLTEEQYKRIFNIK